MDTERTKTPQETAQQVDGAARLFDEHHSYIQATIQYFTKDPQEQVEFYQELFIYFVRKPVREDVIRIKAYLYRVILDRFRDRKRHQARYRKHLEAYAHSHPGRPCEPENPSPDRQKMVALFALIEERLTQKEAEVVLCKYKEDIDVEEIAHRMNVTPETVRRYLSTGLKKLRKLLAKDDKYR